MAERKLRRNQVICREGDEGDCMYYLRWGRVGVYRDFGTSRQKRLAEFVAGEYFGEPGLLKGVRRSATVVALEAGTIVNEITEADFIGCLTNNPNKAVAILQGMCHRLRVVTHDYVEACRAVSAAVGTDTVDSTSDYGLGNSALLRQIHDEAAETDGVGAGGAS